MRTLRDAGRGLAIVGADEAAMTTDVLPTLAPDASTYARLKLAVHALQVLAKEPAHPHYGPLLNACLDGTTYARMANTWRKRDDGKALLDRRPTLQGVDLDLDALARLPPGTLGHEFTRYFADNGIAPFITAFPIATDVDYLSKRYRETHDLFHVVTGYGTDTQGEMELQAFVLGNLALRQTILILLFGTLTHVKEQGPKGLGGYLRGVQRAWRRGRASKELLSVPWETLWEQPVSSLTAQLVASS